MAWIVGVGISDIGAPLGRPTEQLLRQAFEQALEDAGGLTCAHVGAFLSCPAVADGQVFMSAHRVATALGILPSAKAPICRSVDAGGATPVLLVGDAMNLVQNVLNRNQVACVLIGDAAASIPLSDLVKLMTSEGKAIPIPLLYDMVAKWHQKTYGTTREQFAMTSSVMSQHASHTGQAITNKFYSVEQVLKSRKIGKLTNLGECARRADGAGCIIVASDDFVRSNPQAGRRAVRITGFGEASNIIDFRSLPAHISEDSFCLRQASEKALEQAKRGIADFGFFAIYDCFPVCFLKSLEDLGLCPVGKSGPWIQNKYEELVRLKGSGKSEEEIEREFVKVFPFNTHGGLMHFAAPWEAPAAFNIIEAVQQLREECDKSYKQVKFPRDKTKIALVTGNGGVFSSAGVLVIEKNHLNKSNL